MASKMYGKLLPDYGDLDNKTKTCPGYRLFVLENDGGVSVQLIHADENPSTARGHSVFLNVKEARELIAGLEEAVGRASIKNASHKDRGVDC